MGTRMIYYYTDLCTSTSDCTDCPGIVNQYDYTYNCSVIGGSFTVWRITTASGVQCDITLSHNETERSYGFCDSYRYGYYWEDVYAMINRYNTTTRSYTSQLYIFSYSRSFGYYYDYTIRFYNGSTIECLVHDDNFGETLIYSTTMLIPSIRKQLSIAFINVTLCSI